MNLNLSQTIKADTEYSRNSANDVIVEMKSYDVVGDNIQQHFEYKMQCVSNLSHSQSNEWDISRRYSDFTFLSKCLERYYGSLIPPLPPKQLYSVYPVLNSEIAIQRSQELGLFVRNIARHHQLHSSFEFTIFLHASTDGFKTFRAIMDRLPDILMSQLSPTSSSNGTGPGGAGDQSALSTSQPYGNTTRPANATISGTLDAAGSLVLGYASSLWGMSQKLLDLKLSNPPFSPPPIDTALQHSFDHQVKMLHALGVASSCMQRVLQIGKYKMDELAGIGYYLGKVYLPFAILIFLSNSLLSLSVS